MRMSAVLVAVILCLLVTDHAFVNSAQGVRPRAALLAMTDNPSTPSSAVTPNGMMCRGYFWVRNHER
jgi:hypothetical protein